MNHTTSSMIANYRSSLRRANLHMNALFSEDGVFLAPDRLGSVEASVRTEFRLEAKSLECSSFFYSQERAEFHLGCWCRHPAEMTVSDPRPQSSET